MPDFRTAPGSVYSNWYNIITFIIIIIIFIIIPRLTQLSSSSITLTQSLLNCPGVGFFYRAWRPVDYFTTRTMSSKFVLLSLADGWLLMAVLAGWQANMSGQSGCLDWVRKQGTRTDFHRNWNCRDTGCIARLSANIARLFWRSVGLAVCRV